MKRTLLTVFTCICALSTFGQQTSHSWDYDGLTREYIQYVPSVYDGSEAVPLVIALHGLGDTKENFSNVGFQAVADTANFLVVYPEAIVDPMFTQATAWNSGAGVAGFSLNANIDDVGFLNALIDTISANFNIDQSRVYATGFSMGGFMSNRLACELNNRIAAIASVAGTVGGTLTCTPGQEIPVCHFHGTADTQVGYGTAGGGDQDNTFGNNVLDWISFWNTNNGCASTTLEGQFPNLSGDGLSVEYVEYAGCTNSARTVHYKVNGANHVWLFRPNNDISYTLEIWKFFLGLSPDNLVPAGISEVEQNSVGVYPNPVTNVLNIEALDSKLVRGGIFNAEGQLVREFTSLTTDVSELNPGVYQLLISTEDGLLSSSFVKQ
jgi:polyhydroxybutyrate depolymerase